MGVTATRFLQNRTAAGFLQTAQVTRHWAGYHGATDLPNAGVETISPQWLADQQAPPYRAMQTGEAVQGDGGGGAVNHGAEGIMCAIAEINGVPSCANPYLLQTLLRDAWGATSYVQGDCCGSINSMVDPHHYYGNLTQAVAGAMAAGTQASYDGDESATSAALHEALALGLVSEATLDAAVARLLLTRFRLGEFDTGNPANAFAPGVYPLDPAALDGPAHRALAREAAAASVVLLENRARVLPLSAAAMAGKTVAVLGPWAQCAETDNGYGCAPCYSHSYSGAASAVSTILSALNETLQAAGGVALTYSEGVTQYGYTGPTGIADAVAAAAASDLAVLVLGLGCAIEAEGQDRANFSLPFVQQQLLDAVAAAVPPSRLLLVLNSAGGIDYDTAVADTALTVFYGGEETGHGLTDVLFGAVAPAGRLPVTWYRNSYLSLVNSISDFDMVSNGTGRTYRFLLDHAQAVYRFGYGLSYSSFEYADLAAAAHANGTVSVSFSVRNAGGIDSREVAQLYVSVPSPAPDGAVVPSYSLQAFRVLPTAAGGPAVPVSFSLLPSQFATTLRNGTRLIAGGTYTLWVSGHLPDDSLGRAVSNVLSTTVALPQRALAL